MTVRLLTGDCRDRMAELPECSVDAIVCDPPYGLTSTRPTGRSAATKGRVMKGFMGLAWDGQVPGVEFWQAALRVAKPGAHLIAFGGTRTFHRLACAIEDAGWELRDTLGWLYGSGFPKSLDVSKAIDKAAGAQREVVGDKLDRPGYHLHGHAGGAFYGGGIGSSTGETRLRAALITAPTTDAARQWEGWGTALKPGYEPVILATKPANRTAQWVTIKAQIERLWSRLWSMSPASAADQFSASNLRACAAAPFDFARWDAESARSTRAALCDQMGTSRFELAMLFSLSTVSSWNDTLAEACRAESTSTTETESRPTTDLRTLRFCLSKITPESIILAHRSGAWSSADACNAARYLSATLAMSAATRELSVLGSAIGEDLHSSQGVGGSVEWRKIILARKPLAGTVAANVQAHGTGALNIDGCRVGAESTRRMKAGGRNDFPHEDDAWQPRALEVGSDLGRWPANILHDGSDEVMAVFPSGAGGGFGKRGGNRRDDADFGFGATMEAVGYGDTGSAARFFWSPKTSTAERNIGMPPGRTNTHPTVKPVDLMAYLCRLVCPPGGTILDPFMGSGSTGLAALREGFGFIGIDLDPEHCRIARLRITGDAPLLAKVAT